LNVRSRTSSPDRAADTATRLLDAAEDLFGRHGFDGVGMRALADAAGVNLGAATYHFGSKEALYLETFLRRFHGVAAAQARALTEAEAGAQGHPLPVETIVRCMAEPPFLVVRDQPAFALLLARNLVQPPPFMVRALQEHLDPSLAPFLTALARALPHVPPEILRLRIGFAGGVLHTYSLPGPRMQAAEGAAPPAPHPMLFEEVVRFISAGLSSAVPGNTSRTRANPRKSPPPQ
jgi:AcrR family transcriptional regulator